MFFSFALCAPLLTLFTLVLGPDNAFKYEILKKRNVKLFACAFIVLFGNNHLNHLIMLTHVTRQRARGTQNITYIFWGHKNAFNAVFSAAAAGGAVAVPPPCHPFFDLHFTNYTAISIHFTFKKPESIMSTIRLSRCLCVCECLCCALCAFVLWMVMSTLAIHLAMELKQIHKSQSIEAKQIVNHRPASTMIQRKEERTSNQQQQQQPTIQITLTECCIRTKRNGDMQARTFHTHSHTHTIL